MQRSLKLSAAVVAMATLVLLPGSRDLVELTGEASASTSAAPYGSLDAASAGVIGGWAYDPDSSSEVEVHIYVDGVFHQILLANSYRPDLVSACPLRNGYCGFHWDYTQHRGFGRGSHSIAAWLRGVNATGTPDGINAQAGSSPKTLSDGCSFLGNADGSYQWCNDGAYLNYWETRQPNTEMIFNDGLMAGVSRDIGGTLTQLYRGNPGQPVRWGRNLIDEHGGSAVQLSVWGYAGPQPPACPEWPHPLRPWNPLQARAEYCGWAGPSNNVAVACWVSGEGSTACGSGSASYYVLHDGLSNYTVYAGQMPVNVQQWVTPQPGYVRIKYRLTSSASTEGPHPQEIPALYTSRGINEAYYSYIGSAPFTGAAVASWGKAYGGRLLYVRGSGPYVHEGFPGITAAGCATEGWWGVCDAGAANCVTVAGLDPTITEGSLTTNAPGGETGVITPVGGFAITAGSRDISLAVFPYRFDEVPPHETRTVRQIVQDFANQTGFNSRPVACGSRSPGQFPVTFP